MSAGPASFITDWMSAKSRLINPGAPIRSMIPLTAWSRTSSTTPNASTMEASAASTSPTRSFGTMIRASTCASSSSAAASAMRRRCDPSKPNGLVTTAIVRAPCSLALAATTGAAPEPVPPPRPAVTNTRSAPDTARPIHSASSSAARRPTSGSPPEPRPPVVAPPIRTFSPAFERRRACASVLKPTKLTGRIPAATIRSTALFPPPPTPTTLIARCSGRRTRRTQPGTTIRMRRERRTAATMPTTTAITPRSGTVPSLRGRSSPSPRKPYRRGWSLRSDEGRSPEGAATPGGGNPRRFRDARETGPG